MSFQSDNEDIDANRGPMLTNQEPTGDPSSWRQDDAPTGLNRDPDDSESRIGNETPPARDPQELIAILGATPRELGRIVEGESQERLAQPASDGDWGVVEILPHIGDWEAVAAFWINRILEEDTPVLEAVDDSLWAIEHDYANEDPFDALQRFSRLRHELIEVLEGLSDEDWQRPAIHAAHGRMTLHQFADRICDHDARYLAQARDALA